MTLWSTIFYALYSVVFGFDHRVGHFRPPSMGKGSTNPPFFRGLGASTWDIVC